NIFQRGIALGFGHAMHAGHGHVSAPPILNRIEEKFPRAILIEHADPNAKHVYFFNLHSKNTQPLNHSTSQLLQTFRPNFFSSSACADFTTIEIPPVTA